MTPLEGRSRAWAVATLLALALASLFFTKLALFVGFLVLVVWLSLSRAERSPWTRAALGAAAVAAGLGSTRFIIKEAVPGIVQGGSMTAENKAVSMLREILFVQDAMRRYAYVDPDGDGIGSAGRILELTGQVGLRGGAPLDPAPLRWTGATTVNTALGPALQLGGYLFAVCLPSEDGSWTAHMQDSIDDESAERRFVAHAWPAKAENHLFRAFSIDVHDRILASPNRRGRELVYVGSASPPPCSAGEGGPAYEPWRGKTPRTRIPHDIDEESRETPLRGRP